MSSPVSRAPRDEDEKMMIRNAMQGLYIFRAAGAKGKGFLSEEQLQKVCDCVEYQELPFQHIVQREGEPVKAVVVVLNGTLAKFQRSKETEQLELVEHLQKGGQIGQLHMIASSDVGSSTVIVDSDVAHCAVLKRSDLDDLMKSDTELLRAICNNLALALRDQVRRSSSIALVRLVEHLDSVTVGEQVQTTSGRVQFLAAAISGIGSMTLGYPLDVARTRLQTEGRGDLVHGLKMLVQIARTDGFFGLYRGWSSHTISHTLQNATYHSAYGRLTKLVKGSRATLSDPVRLLLGVCAGAIAAFCVTPLSVLTFRLQGKEGASHNLLTMLLKIIATDGFFSLWHGIGPSLVLAINPCITFYVFDELRAHILRRKAAQATEGGSFQTKLTPLETLIIGAAAKAVASIITFPLLMAKIRMGLYGKERYPSMLSTFTTVLREEGVNGLFKGMGLSLMRSITVAALEFMLRDRATEAVTKALNTVAGAKKEMKKKTIPPRTLE